MRWILVPLMMLAAACGGAPTRPPRVAASPAASPPTDAVRRAPPAVAPPACPTAPPDRECWNLRRGDAWAELCVEHAHGEAKGGRVRMSGAHPLDVPYARVHREGAAGHDYEELLDARGTRVLLLVRCGPCGCGGCLREARLGDDPPSAAWTNPACPSVTFEGCPTE